MESVSSQTEDTMSNIFDSFDYYVEYEKYGELRAEYYQTLEKALDAIVGADQYKITHDGAMVACYDPEDEDGFYWSEEASEIVPF